MSLLLGSGFCLGGGKGKGRGVLPDLVMGEAEEKGEIKYSDAGSVRNESSIGSRV